MRSEDQGDPNLLSRWPPVGPPLTLTVFATGIWWEEVMTIHVMTALTLKFPSHPHVHN